MNPGKSLYQLVNHLFEKILHSRTAVSFAHIENSTGVNEQALNEGFVIAFPLHDKEKIKEKAKLKGWLYSLCNPV